MTTMAQPTKVELLHELRTTRDDVISHVAAMDDTALAGGRYEHGWDAREILAHIASIEWTYPRLIDLAAQPDEAQPDEAQPAANGNGSPAIPAATAPAVSDYNGRQVAKRAAASRSDLLDEFRKNRNALIAAVEATPDDMFDRHVRSFGGVEGPLGAVIRLVAIDHVRAHLNDMIGGGA